MVLMLGVRAVGVVVVASEFRKSSLLSYHRGELTMLDRKALEAQACSCYAPDRQICAELSASKP